jgi:hypothetical protein
VRCVLASRSVLGRATRVPYWADGWVDWPGYTCVLGVLSVTSKRYESSCLLLLASLLSVSSAEVAACTGDQPLRAQLSGMQCMGHCQWWLVVCCSGVVPLASAVHIIVNSLSVEWTIDCWMDCQNTAGSMVGSNRIV